MPWRPEMGYHGIACVGGEGFSVNTVLGIMFKLLAVAWRPPTAGPWIEAVASGMMARDLVEASAALELSPAAIEMFSAALSTYEGADVEEALHVIRREETRLFIGPDPVVENSEGTWLQRAHGVAHPIRMINNHSVARGRLHEGVRRGAQGEVQ